MKKQKGTSQGKGPKKERKRCWKVKPKWEERLTRNRTAEKGNTNEYKAQIKQPVMSCSNKG